MKDFIKRKRNVILFIIILLLILCVFLLFFDVSNKKSEYSNQYYKIKYDSTWKIDKKNDNDLVLEHKKTKSLLTINYKIVEDDLLDISLENLVNDLSYSIQEQNKNYKLLSKNIKDYKYEAFEFLYEDEEEQALVTIIKKDNVLLFVTYNAESDCFDIVLDSVNSIINTLEIFSGELIN